MNRAADRGPPRLGPYQAVRELARGGMGAVWEAVHPTTGARHALKVILGGPTGADPVDLLRFRREAEVLARLDHPHIVHIHMADLSGAAPWLAQDLLPGGSLHRGLEGGALPVDEAVGIARKLAGALAHAHARQVLHRDLKPHNILFDDRGEPCLVDFGLGLAQDDVGERLTRSGTILGTPAYMAPEQASGVRAETARTDVYGLGAVLYAMLAGHAPFDGPSTFAVLEALMSRDPPPLGSHVPAWLRRVVARAMARRPEDRFPDMTALEAALASPEQERQRPRGLAVLVAVALGSATLGVVALVAARREPATPVADVAPLPRAATDRPSPPPARTPPPSETALARADALHERAAASGRVADFVAAARTRCPPRSPATAAAAESFWSLKVAIDDGRLAWEVTERSLTGDGTTRTALLDVAEAIGAIRLALGERGTPAELVARAPRFYSVVGHLAKKSTGPSRDELPELFRELLERTGDDPYLRYYEAVLDERRAVDRDAALRALEECVACWVEIAREPPRGPNEVLIVRGHLLGDLYDRLVRDGDARAKELLRAECAHEVAPSFALETWAEARVKDAEGGGSDAAAALDDADAALDKLELPALAGDFSSGPRLRNATSDLRKQLGLPPWTRTGTPAREAR